MNKLEFTHQSVLRFITEMASEFASVDQMAVEPINLDALASEVELPSNDFVGMQNFAMYSANDGAALTATSAMIVCATYNDANNMRLMSRLNVIFEVLQPGSVIPYYDNNNQRVGELKMMGTTRLMPVIKNSQVAMQGITFQASIQSVN